MPFLRAFFRQSLDSLRDIAPVLLVVGFFQFVVIRQPLPEDLTIFNLAIGLVSVVLGLTLFVQGLQVGLFPIGENLAQAFARKGSTFWLLLFSFALGFGTTVAEPALIAVAGQAAIVMAEGGLIQATERAQNQFAVQLRLVVALSVGSAVALGVLRILKGWPLHLLIIAGYAIA